MAASAPGLDGLAVDRSSPLPVYVQMRQQLLDVLDARRAAGVEAFFTDDEIAQHYGVSRMTARQALGELAREGLVYRRKGLGTFIAPRKLTESEGPDGVGNFFEEWLTLGHTVAVEVLAFEEVACPAALRPVLGVGSATSVLHFLRRRLADGVPVALDYRWVAPPTSASFRREDLLRTSIHVIAAPRLGGPVGTSTYEIEAARCSREHADLLELEPDEPVLIRSVTTSARDGSPLWTGRSIYRADIYKYRVVVRPRALWAED